MYSNNSFAEGVLVGQNNGYGNRDGWGMDGGWWGLILLFALFGWGGNGFGFGFGNNGWGGNGFGYGYGPYQPATQGDVQRGFDTSTIIGKLDGISNGICDSTFALNNTIVNGFNGVNSAVCNLGYEQAQLHNATQMAIMQGFNAASTQLSDCCCRTQTGLMQLGNQVERGFCDTNYNLATNTNSIIQNAHNDTDRVIAKLDAMEMSRKDETIAALRSQVDALNLAQSQANQNSVLVAAMDANKAEILRRTGAECPTPAYVVQPPQPVTFPTNCCGQAFYGGNYGNSGCGGCGCGC